MKLENQCVSLELSKKLKELGYPQESLFYWHYSYNPTAKKVNEPYVLFNPYEKGDEINISAPTVAELGRYMPTTYLGDLVSLIPNKTVGGYWRVDLDDEGMLCSETTEADARAKLLIYLLENNLIEIKAGHIFYGKVVIISNK